MQRYLDGQASLGLGIHLLHQRRACWDRLAVVIGTDVLLVGFKRLVADSSEGLQVDWPSLSAIGALFKFESIVYC